MHMTEDTLAPQLNRVLKPRHIQLIAIGGAIGVGLFLGSASAIKAAGPGLLLCYAVAGLAIFFMLRALGELMMYRPVAGSFVSYAEEFLGPFAGFVTGWSYWFLWVVAGMAELTAIGIYFHYWFPDLPQWIPALLALCAMAAANLLTVRMFGELEFWFALIKVLMIAVLLVSGTAILLFGWSNLGATAHISNLWEQGGFLPFGFVGLALSLQMVAFAFSGVELIGVTAGEAENPETTLPRATNSVIFRILLFYIGSLIVVMALIPWRELDPAVSPFVTIFGRMGIPGAAGWVTFVVITSAGSACNSGIFSNGRMLYSLARGGHAPRFLGNLNRAGVPSSAVMVSSAFMLGAVALNFLIPDDVFIWVTSTTLVGTLWTWGVIILSHGAYRRAVNNGSCKAVAFRLPFAGFARWFVLAFLLATTVALSLRPDTRVALYVAPIWFGILALAYKRTRLVRSLSSPTEKTIDTY
jgi:AAT family amino acid transporter